MYISITLHTHANKHFLYKHTHVYIHTVGTWGPLGDPRTCVRVSSDTKPSLGTYVHMHICVCKCDMHIDTAYIHVHAYTYMHRSEHSKNKAYICNYAYTYIHTYIHNGVSVTLTRASKHSFRHIYTYTNSYIHKTMHTHSGRLAVMDLSQGTKTPFSATWERLFAEFWPLRPHYKTVSANV